ncbi:hypothetical protein [Leptolyngbya sp. O-77]|uniref:hypothetical protein n=1 Tax=Leptolyngbya sp. O-77 TaxID=1080068 RepID=UPI0012E33215|nr:hypothetical protein [Leptolyngbya sp. O-77]
MAKQRRLVWCACASVYTWRVVKLGCNELARSRFVRPGYATGTQQAMELGAAFQQEQRDWEQRLT